MDSKRIGAAGGGGAAPEGKEPDGPGPGGAAPEGRTWPLQQDSLAADAAERKDTHARDDELGAMMEVEGGL
jgi:hypothetical protein